MSETHDVVGAFQAAIDSGLLSKAEVNANYAGRYMYMFSDEQGDRFKHIDTRQYIINGTVNDDDPIAPLRLGYYKGDTIVYE